MSIVTERVAEMAAARRVQLPAIRTRIADWRRAESVLPALARAIDDLREHPGVPPSVARQLDWIRLGDSDLGPAITAAVRDLQRLECRVRRDTVTIGVGGSTRAGKSTVLQSITGLDDGVLPTADRSPATAVRCRIHHVPGRRRALLDLHTFDTFRSAYLLPRHAALGLAATPGGVTEFGDWRYPARRVAQARDLRDMQAALWSYEALLERPGRRLELTGDDLRQLPGYVSYPATGDPARRYLAVRDVRIECDYPNADMGAIAIVDLPGFTAGYANQRLLAELRYDVDQVILVKRGTTWTDADTRALDQMAFAGGSTHRRDAVVFVAVNVEGRVRGPGRRLRDAVARAAAARGSVRCEVVSVDARSAAGVAERLLHPVLDHLARTLPAADAALLADLDAHRAPLRDDLVVAAVATKAALRPLDDPARPAAEDIHRRAAGLRRGIRTGLADTIDRLRAWHHAVEPGWAEAVRSAHRETVEWIEDGLGIGRSRWSGHASRGLGRECAPGRFVDAELARIRLGIGDLYAGLDRYLDARIDDLFNQVASVFVTRLGALLAGLSGRDALRRLAEIAEGTAQPCRTLPEAVRDLLAVRLDYRTQLHPRVRPALDALHAAQTPPSTGDGVETLRRTLRDRAGQATGKIRADLLREPFVPGMVAFAAVERFADVVTRSAAARRELHLIASSYRTAVWPDVPAPLDRTDARVAAAVRAADDLLDVTTALAAPMRPGRNR